MGVIKWDGWEAGTIQDYWTQPDSMVGTVWRIVLNNGKTLVVVPYQSPNDPAPKLHKKPERIDPILAGPHCMGYFAEAVWGLAEANTKDTREELRDVLRRYGVKDLQADKFKELCGFIRPCKQSGKVDEWERLLDPPLFRAGAALPPMSNEALRQVLKEVREITGHDITESVLLDFWPGMAAHVDQWTKETAKAEDIEEVEARKRLFDRVRWMADFGDRNMWLVQSITEEDHSAEDMNPAIRSKVNIPGEKSLIVRLDAMQGAIVKEVKAVVSSSPKNQKDRMNQKEAAEYCGITPRTLRRWVKVALIRHGLRYCDAVQLANEQLPSGLWLSESTLSKITTGRQRVKPEQAEALVSVLGVCSVADLFPELGKDGEA